MKLKVNHEELNNVAVIISKDYEQMFKEIEGIKGEINNLKLIWQGEESEIFYSRIENYLENMKSIPETYNTLAKFINKSNRLYDEADIEFARGIERVRND